MKTRIILHKAYNKHGCTSVLVEVAGRLIPFKHSDVNWFRRKSATDFVDIVFITAPSVDDWKRDSRKVFGAHRFERVTILGEARPFKQRMRHG